MKAYIREPINGFTHLGGAILSFIGLLALVIKTTLTSPNIINIAAVIIFGISLILLYSSSATYHLVVSSDNVIAFLRWISTSIYIGMGWISIFIIVPLYNSIALGGIALLVLGGILYTIGAVIYGLKPRALKFKNLGFHEIFHIFILLCSLSLFFAVF